MPFIPHTEQELKEMLATIGVNSIEDLYDEIPDSLRVKELSNIPTGITEMELAQELEARAQRDVIHSCFIGAGAYNHHIPAAVWEIANRGEFYTAYTPYQAEASQGNLQLIYEFQTMMASLTGMDVSNASIYDGATALAESLLMAVRIKAKTNAKKVLVPRTVHPSYRNVINTILKPQRILVEEVPYSVADGNITLSGLKQISSENIAALVIPQPNFFGTLEEVDELTDWAHQHNILVVAVVNPVAMAILKEPGQWGTKGADIVCGEGQPLGIPLMSGGPYFGFMCCKQDYVRQMPGRIVGKTVDTDGKEGFTLTLQAREQHIRRSKATSNICTNQGLVVTAATIYMSLLGAEGLRRVAECCHENARDLLKELTRIEGIQQVFHRPFFHEFVIRFEKPVIDVLEGLTRLGIQGGYDLTSHYPELGSSLLVCATEKNSPKDLTHYYNGLQHVLHKLPTESYLIDE